MMETKGESAKRPELDSKQRAMIEAAKQLLQKEAVRLKLHEFDEANQLQAECM